MNGICGTCLTPTTQFWHSFGGFYCTEECASITLTHQKWAKGIPNRKKQDLASVLQALGVQVVESGEEETSEEDLDDEEGPG